jgi:flagellar hook-associated protein 3 FlgL
MRVSNLDILRNSQARMQTTLSGIDKLREDIASGVTIRRMSDAPNLASEVSRTGSSLRAITQFRRNIDRGVAKAQAEEAALDTMGDLLTRAIELGIAQANATAGTATRNMVKGEVDQLLATAVIVGNSQFGDEFVFGGTRSGEKPFRIPPTPADGFSNLTLGGVPVDPSGSPTVEIGIGRHLAPNRNGTELFLDTDAFEALRALSTALGNDDRDAIAQATARLSTANDAVQAHVAEVGARIDEFEGAQRALDTTEQQLIVYRSDLRDTEVDKAIAELVGKQTLYQAAMSATSRILGMSLVNYL